MMIQYIIVNLILPVVKPSCEIFAAFFIFLLLPQVWGLFYCERSIIMPVTVKKAAASDLPAVAGLYGSVCDDLQGRPYNPGWSRDGFPTVDCAREYLEKGILLLALEDGEPAGSVGLTKNPSAEEGFPGAPAIDDRIWYIHVLAVHPEHQRRGISSMLLFAAGDHARGLGADTLRLYVWEGNYPAIRAYEKHGFSCVQQGVDIGLAEFGLARFSLYEKAL